MADHQATELNSTLRDSLAEPQGQKHELSYLKEEGKENSLNISSWVKMLENSKTVSQYTCNYRLKTNCINIHNTYNS